jgi:thioredoxin reductase (NADPH)
MLDIIVIGSGPAGVSAAVYLKRFNLDVAVISNDNTALSSAHQIDNYYGFYGVSGEELYQNGIKQLKSLEVNVINETVLAIEAYNHFIVTTNKGVYEAKKVILATGKSRNKLKVKNAKDYEMRGLSYCATCDGFFYRGKKIGIIGSGSAMMHELSFLKNMTNDITIFTDGDFVTVEGFKVVNEEIVSLYGNEYLEGVITKCNQYELDGLFVAIGDASTFDFIK